MMAKKVVKKPTGARPTRGTILLSIRNCQGIITPAVVRVNGGLLQVRNTTDVDATIVLPCGLTAGDDRCRCVWHCPPKGHVEIAIISKTEAKKLGLLGVQVPYWVYFYDRSGKGIRDWGIAGSPPAMQVGP